MYPPQVEIIPPRGGGYTSGDDSDCPAVVDGSDSGSSDDEEVVTPSRVRRPARQQQCRVPGRKRILHMYAGESDVLGEEAGRVDTDVEPVDILRGGAAMDMREADRRDPYLARAEEDEWDALLVGVPCATYSVLNALGGKRQSLRSRRKIFGRRGLTDPQRAYLREHDGLTDFAVDLIEVFLRRGLEVIVENPVDRKTGPVAARWPARAWVGSLWIVPRVAKLFKRKPGGLTMHSNPQCAAGSLDPGEHGGQKWTSWGCSDGTSERMGDCDELECHHAVGEHQPVFGKSAEGVSLARRAGTYPRRQCRMLIYGLVGRRPGAWARPVAQAVSAGRITEGYNLSEEVAERIEAARWHPPRWSSLRNRAAATHEELLAGEIPTPHHAVGGGVQTEAPRVEVPQPAWRVHIYTLWKPEANEKRTHWLRVLAQQKMDAIRCGRGHEVADPPTLEFDDDDLQDWVVERYPDEDWDCADPDDCKILRASTRHTDFPGDEQVDREAFREMAAENGWYEIDRDICDQCGEGGTEARVARAQRRRTRLAFHQSGLAEHFEIVETMVREEMAKGWLQGCSEDIPFTHCNLMPRNAIMQARTRWTISGGLEDYFKARVTSHLSAALLGKKDSMNGGMVKANTEVGLPEILMLGRAAAIVDAACAADGTCAREQQRRKRLQDEGRLAKRCTRIPKAAASAYMRGSFSTRVYVRRSKAGFYCYDVMSAYRYLVTQRRDWPMQCFLWPAAVTHRVGVTTDTRTVFGGGHGPNRFERFIMVPRADARRRCNAFDDAHPYEAGVQAWREAQLARIAVGELPNLPELARPASLQYFIDDGAGTGPGDVVPVPEYLAHITLGEDATVRAGGVPAAGDERYAVHCRMSIYSLRLIQLKEAPLKTECGTAIINLGAALSYETGGINCPEGKRLTMLRSLGDAAEAVRERLALDHAEMQTLTGRLVNWSRIEPGLMPFLEGGYAVVRGKQVRARRTRTKAGGTEIVLRQGGRAAQLLLNLAEVGSILLEANRGVPLAARSVFPDRNEPGVATLSTDASGEDGYGGYGFLAGDTKTVYAMWEFWEPDVLAALKEMAKRAHLREPGAALFSMPGGELVTPIIFADALARITPISAVISVVDCAPAGAALSAAVSPVPQLMELLRASREITEQWLGVHIPREWNVDCDRLSHPLLGPTVCAEAEAAGLTVVRVRPHPDMLARLRSVLRLKPWDPVEFGVNVRTMLAPSEWRKKKGTRKT